MVEKSCKDRSDGVLWSCCREGHNEQCSIRKGSWFGGSNMTMQEIIKFTYWWCMGVKQEICRKQVKVVVRIDASKFGKWKYRKGHEDHQWIFGGIEAGSRKSFLVPVERCDSATLIPLIEKWILPGATVFSDSWKPCDVLSEQDFIHMKVNHSFQFDIENTKKSHGHQRHARKSFPSFACRNEHHSSYLAEFLWRNTNKEVEDLFIQFLKDVQMVYECE